MCKQVTNLAVNSNSNTAIEIADHLKNGANPKNQRSRRNFFYYTERGLTVRRVVKE
jgi:predicted transcriptional regulator